LCITAMINHVFISFTAAQIYGLSYFHLPNHLSSVTKTNSYVAKSYSVTYQDQLSKIT